MEDRWIIYDGLIYVGKTEKWTESSVDNHRKCAEKFEINTEVVPVATCIQEGNADSGWLRGGEPERVMLESLYWKSPSALLTTTGFPEYVSGVDGHNACLCDGCDREVRYVSCRLSSHILAPPYGPTGLRASGAEAVESFECVADI
ncbi:hypothetical protein MRX96_011164 [Rhipicephalus microplus]